MATHLYHNFCHFSFEYHLKKKKKKHAVAILYHALYLLSTYLLEGFVYEGLSIMSLHQH